MLAGHDRGVPVVHHRPGRVAGRRFHNQITLFKSVGTAIEDLAAAILVFETMLGTAAELGPNTGVLRG